MSVPIAEALPPATMRRCGPELNRRFQFGLPGMSSKSTESPLFPELTAYLQFAHQLRDKARDICQRVHDGKHLTPPPW